MTTKRKKIVYLLLWCSLAVSFFITLGFVDKKEAELVCRDLDVHVNYDDDNFFVDEADIRQIIRNKGDSIIHQPLSTIDIPALEKAINTHAAIENAEVYVTINGELKVEVEQRKPLLRIINARGESYYMDTRGKLMPLSDKYTARVLIANGNIEDGYAARYKYEISEYETRKELKKSLLDDLYTIAQCINADAFWTAQIQQLFVNENREFELIPRVGDHKIILGDASEAEVKLQKLMTFYREGLNATGSWNKYAVINLKYKNQVVCTKKE